MRPAPGNRPRQGCHLLWVSVQRQARARTLHPHTPARAQRASQTQAAVRSIVAVAVALGNCRPATAPPPQSAWRWALATAPTTTAATLLPCAATALLVAAPPSVSRPIAMVPARRCQIRTGSSTHGRELARHPRPPPPPHRVPLAQEARYTPPRPLPAPGCRCSQDRPSATIPRPFCTRTARCFWPARGPCVAPSLEQRLGLGVSLGLSLGVDRWAHGSTSGSFCSLSSCAYLEPRLLNLRVPASCVHHRDPFLFVDRRGRFHILAHIWAHTAYPDNPISGHAFSEDGYTLSFEPRSH